jgi:hypothetical protein
VHRRNRVSCQMPNQHGGHAVCSWIWCEGAHEHRIRGSRQRAWEHHITTTASTEGRVSFHREQPRCKSPPTRRIAKEMGHERTAGRAYPGQDLFRNPTTRTEGVGLWYRQPLPAAIHSRCRSGTASSMRWSSAYSSDL